MTRPNKRPRSPFIVLPVLAVLAACAQAPEPLGAANAANLATQAVDPLPELAGRDAIEGGTGSRAGLAVEALRKRAEKSGGDT